MRKNNSTPEKIYPAKEYVLIKPSEEQEQTGSGLSLPKPDEERPQFGKVLEVGRGKEPPCKRGDRVIYKKWGGNDVKIEGKEILFIKFEDILAVIKKKK